MLAPPTPKREGDPLWKKLFKMAPPGRSYWGPTGTSRGSVKAVEHLPV